MKSRVGARVRAWIALAAFLCTFGLPSLSSEHRSAADDAGCRVSAGAEPGDADARIRVDEGETAAHCPLCHFQRAVGGASTTDFARVTAPGGPSAEFPPAIDHALTAALSLRASRGPPVSL